MHQLQKLSDYSAIKKLAAALHRFGSSRHGVAIMIGAGFSRSAAHHVSGNKKMPLWDSFSKNLLRELNPHNHDLSFSDPLRVAEEYRAYFGQSALNDQIRTQIDNDAWRTGPLYEELLELPWSEIMTTNWDTLLERAAKDIHGPYYTPVCRASDLAWAPTPRIVKLHGTIGITDTFVAAQEDYRTYPEKFAPFVNFARHVFIENELCLLGFSGEDPNFLQWTGWVRDHLTDHARKIYLVGALHLSAPQRVYLESINIAPIDLWDAVKEIPDHDLRHQTALTLFLKAMGEEGKTKAKPYKWQPSSLRRAQVEADDHARIFKDHGYAAQLLKAQLGTLKADRESYPGWLVCPPSLRWQVQNQVSDPHPSVNNLAALDPDDRAKLLYELAWRYGISFDHISSWLVEAFIEIASQEEPCAISKSQQMEIALILLKNSRWLDTSKAEEEGPVDYYVGGIRSLLEKYAEYLPDCAAELAYHQALVARDCLNYAEMETLVKKIQGEDPVWKLRRAALLMELGRFEEGEGFVREAYRELRERYRYNQDSIRILSRLMWCHWLLKATTRFQTDKAIDSFPSIPKDWLCDPWTWIEDIQRVADRKQEAYIKSQRPIEPLFQQGHYRDNSNSQSFNSEIPDHLLLESVTREVGIPLRSGGAFANVSLLAGPAEKLTLSCGAHAELRDYILSIRAASSETSSSVKDVFTRVGVACTRKEVVETLISRLLPAIDYWCKQRNEGGTDQKKYALSPLRVLIEVLARLVVRASAIQAKEIFKLAISFGHQDSLRHFWLFEVMEHLIVHSLSSVPTLERADLLPDALKFPLQGEVQDDTLPHWPNPIIDRPNSRDTYPNLDNRIRELIEAVRGTNLASKTAALQRLLPLSEKSGFLSQAERTDLADAIWGNSPNYQDLPWTGLYPHALLLLPVPDDSHTESVVRNYLYERSNGVLRSTQKELRSFPSPEIEGAVEIYAGMANAAANSTTRLFPTSEQAQRLFDQLVTWRPEVEKDDFFGSATNNREQLTACIGKALSYAIAPALADDVKTPERFAQLKSFFEDLGGAASAIPAFIYFEKSSGDTALYVERIIQVSLRNRDANKVAYAGIAMHKWMEFAGVERPQPLLKLIAKLIDIIESGRTVGLQQLIWLAKELLKRNWLSKGQVKTLIEAIPNVFQAANYIDVDPRSREAISASTIREACVKMANALLLLHPDASELVKLIQDSKEDSLPEVRFAGDDLEDK
jgi:hypothetical protein